MFQVMMSVCRSNLCQNLKFHAVFFLLLDLYEEEADTCSQSEEEHQQYYFGLNDAKLF